MRVMDPQSPFEPAIHIQTPAPAFSAKQAKRWIVGMRGEVPVSLLADTIEIRDDHVLRLLLDGALVLMSPPGAWLYVVDHVARL